MASTTANNWGTNLKDAAQAVLIIAAIYLAYRLFKHFTDGSNNGPSFIEENFRDGILMPDGETINVVSSLIHDNIFPHRGVLYELQGNRAVRAPSGTRYQFANGGTAIQNATGNASYVAE